MNSSPQSLTMTSWEHSVCLYCNSPLRCQASPRTRPECLDPVVLLRMSERDWLSVLADLNAEKVTATSSLRSFHNCFQEQETSFGDVDNFDRLIQTCGVNLDTLKKINFGPDVSPKCLPQDHEGMSSTHNNNAFKYS